jgi:hypothetical protein
VEVEPCLLHRWSWNRRSRIYFFYHICQNFFLLIWHSDIVVHEKPGIHHDALHPLIVFWIRFPVTYCFANVANKNRDDQVVKQLESDGWNVLIIWECELKKDKRDETLEHLYHQIVSAK